MTFVVIETVGLETKGVVTIDTIDVIVMLGVSMTVVVGSTVNVLFVEALLKLYRRLRDVMKLLAVMVVDIP